MNSMEPIGPNLRKLALHKVALDAIPPGTKDPINSGIEFLTRPGKMLGESFRAALAWSRDACQAVRGAVDPNPWKNSDDEAIAGELLRLIELKKKRS